MPEPNGAQPVDEPGFYFMDLETTPNVADLLLNVAGTLDQNVTLQLSLAGGGGEPLLGIVSEVDGGIIGYAIGTEHARLFVTALQLWERREDIRAVVAYSLPDEEADWEQSDEAGDAHIVHALRRINASVEEPVTSVEDPL